MPRDEMTSVENHFKKSITAVVARRAEAIRAERKATLEIASLCVDARAESVYMACLASWVKVLGKDDELRSVSRQTIDNIVAQYEGRTRVSRKPRDKTKEPSSKIKLEALQ